MALFLPMPRLRLHAPPGLFRLTLALAVFVHHLSRLAIGSAAVYVFFVLSGYWISTMWRKKYAHARAPYTTFVISRLWRVLPVFVVCSALSWLLLYARHGDMHSTDFWGHQLFSNLFMIGYRSLSLQSNVPAWSLDIEAQFYVVAPLIVATLARSLWFSLVYAAAAVLAALCNDAVSAVPYIAFFVIGIVASIGRWKPGSILALASLVGTGVALAGLLLSPWRGAVLAGTHATPDYVYNPIACVLLALIVVPFAIYTTSQRSSRLDFVCGDLSFVIYLLHFPVLDYIGTGGGGYAARLVAIGAVAALVVAGSLAVHYVIDRPLNRMRTRWVEDRIVGHTPGPSGARTGAGTS